MKRFLLFAMGALCIAGCADDSRTYYNGVVRELSSEEYFGRSNYGDGNVKAATYIISQLQEMGVEPLQATTDVTNAAYPQDKSAVMPCSAARFEDADASVQAYLQNFCVPMNVMRGQMAVSVDGEPLTPTVNFTAKEFSPTCHGDFGVAYLDDAYYTPQEFCRHLNSGDYADKFVVVDWHKYLTRLKPNPMEKYLHFMMPLDKVGGLIMKDTDQFPYFKARTYYTLKMPVLMVDGSFPDNAQRIRVDIDSEMLPSHDCHNVVAAIKGAKHPDKYITFIAHFDHLGLMGDGVVFPGANDNASGVAMLLSLARYYSKHQPDCSLQFIFLDAEENNLLGAFYYAENPRVPLDDIGFLFNFDMIGDDGDKLVCQVSEEGEAGFELFRKLNDKSKHPAELALEPVDDNSDHFAFALKGVPCAYFEWEGNMYQYYHTPEDTFDHASDANFQRLFDLTIKFVSKFRLK